MNDNTTPLSANEYDAEINKTIPFYSTFYEQTIDVITQCNFPSISIDPLARLRMRHRYFGGTCLIIFSNCLLCPGRPFRKDAGPGKK